jgi:homoserine kinase type II
MTGPTNPLPPEEALRARALLASWPLGEVLRLQAVPGGATNRVYRVETATRSAFLRVYKRADRALAEREHALIAQVRAQGLPAVAVIAARSGGTVVEHAGSVAALYEPAAGVQLRGAELSPEQISSAGALLARLHRALAPLHDAGYLHWTLSWDGPAWVERLNVVERVIVARGLAGNESANETDRWALERLRAQRQWLASAECVHRYQPRFPAQVVHGDFQDANLFFAGEQVSALIDWEQAAFMPRAYEVARACGFMFRLRPEPTLHFLRAYASANALEPQALEDGARAWGCFADHHVWPLEELYLHGNEAARRYIPHAPFRPFEQAWAELGLQ